jgi:hypothetical protein
VPKPPASTAAATAAWLAFAARLAKVTSLRLSCRFTDVAVYETCGVRKARLVVTLVKVPTTEPAVMMLP